MVPGGGAWRWRSMVVFGGGAAGTKKATDSALLCCGCCWLLLCFALLWLSLAVAVAVLWNLLSLCSLCVDVAHLGCCKLFRPVALV
eukprot:5626189-Lingulodinium_polyedra.AAC.1